MPCLGPDSRAALLSPKTVGDGPSGKSPESASRSKPRERFDTFMTAKAYDPTEGRNENGNSSLLLTIRERSQALTLGGHGG